MKRNVFCLLLILALCAALAVPAFASPVTSADPVTDQADLLSSTEEDALRIRLEELSRTYNAQIAVVTVPASSSYDVSWYTEYVYDTAGFGYGNGRDGVLLLVCMYPREYRILSNGFAGDAIGDYEIESIGSVIVSDLSDGNYADAFFKFADRCGYYLDGHINGFPFAFGKNLLIAFGIAFVIGLIVVLILKAQLKSVRPQNRASVYVKPGSMQLTLHRDLFLYRDVHRRKKETSSSSGSRSSGGSRHVGGGSF